MTGGGRRRRWSRAGLLLLALASTASADGGFVRASQPLGPYTVTVFSAPTPLRVGAADISVLVQRPDGGVVLDVHVGVVLRGGGQVLEATATRAQATNKLLQAAQLEIPAAGTWTAEVRVGEAVLSLPLEVAPAPPPWQAYWAYLVAPFIALTVFALHQWLRLRARR